MFASTLQVAGVVMMSYRFLQKNMEAVPTIIDNSRQLWAEYTVGQRETSDGKYY